MAWMTAAAIATALRRAGALRGSASLRDGVLLHGPAPLRGPAPPRGAALLHGASPPHGPGPHIPGPYRFGRPRHCIRDNSGPPTPSEEESEKLKQKMESMDKEELLQYAKQVTRDYEKLLERPPCNVHQADMKKVRSDLEEMKAKIGKLQKSIDERQDVTSVYIPGFGSVNVLAVGMFIWQILEKMG